MNKLLFFSFINISILFSQSVNPNFDFSGTDKFWDIVSKLEANREPSQSEWNSLFSTPGYKILLSSEFNKEFFIDNFRLVFKPSLKSELNKKLSERKNNHHLNHYIKVRDNKSLIREQYKKLHSERFNHQAVKRTLEYLPQSYVNQYPPVSFLIFESNGRGSSPIVVDIAASIEWDFLSFLSHEFHHWYRNRQLQYTERVSNDDYNLVNTLALIEAEGIADMVDKKDWYTNSSNSISKYARQFLNDVGRTPAVVKQMDELLKNYENNKRNIGRRIFALLPQRGHTTGYFMARLILEKFSKRELVKCVGNPFEFIKLYNLAAQRSGNQYPSFSRETISVIDDLSKKYSL